MFCPQCGTQNADNARFCATCGTVMQTEQQAPAYNEPAAPQMNYQPVYQAAPQPAYQVAPQPTPASANAPLPGKGMGITSMILGIVSLVLSCYVYLSIPGGIVGLILGCISNSRAKAVGRKNGMATAGIICSAIALGLVVLFLILIVAGVGFMEGLMGSGYSEYYF